MFIKKPQILYSPMLSSFGGGSARGFNPGGGGGLDEFTLTLSNGTTYTQTTHDSGDTDAQINSFFTTNLASDPGYIGSSGTSFYKPYNGYYSMQLAVDCTVTIRCKGASGGYSYNDSWKRTIGYGRDVQGDFSLSANDILVWGVGKTGADNSSGYNGDSNTGGTGGGATFCYKRVSSTNTILAVGAGGSGTPVYEDWHNQNKTQANRNGSSAVALSAKGTGNNNTIRNARSGLSGLYWYSGAYSGGIGRSDAGGAGGGYNNNGRTQDGSTNSNMGNALLETNPNYSGGHNAGRSGKPGGFGGGGGHAGANGYAGGGGGYFGAFECAGLSTGSLAAYTYYAGAGGEAENDYMGPISFVDSAASNFTDNGIYGSPTSTSTDDPMQGGEIVFTFTE